MTQIRNSRFVIPKDNGIAFESPPQYDAAPEAVGLRTFQSHSSSPSLESNVTAKSSLDFTQRIERKLAKYNASDNVFKRWLFEIISWLVSALCMIAIMLIYVRVKDHPISEQGSFLTWTNVLGKISSAALIVPTSEALGQLKWSWFHNSKAMWDFEIFDKASRGPWGAVMLLYRTKGRSLAALGALLILSLLAIDTFFQQVVDLPEEWTLQSTAAVAPLTVFYDPDNPPQYQGGYEMAQMDRDMSLTINKFSFSNGTQPVKFGNGTRPDIPLVCILLQHNLYSLAYTPTHSRVRLATVPGHHTIHWVFVVNVQTSRACSRLPVLNTR